MKRLAQRILDEHHAFAHKELPVLDGLFTMHPDAAFRRAWVGLSETFQEHMRKEEHILFPAILEGYVGLEGPITVMEQEHHDLHHYARQVRLLAAAAGPHESRLLAFLDDLVEHSRVEDEELFPLARKSEHVAVGR